MTEMNCRRTVGALMDYADRRLAPPAIARLEAHLAKCPRCAEFSISYRAVTKIAQRATQEDIPPAVALRLRSRIGLSS